MLAMAGVATLARESRVGPTMRPGHRKTSTGKCPEESTTNQPKEMK